MDKKALKESAVPTKLPNCPDYLSASASTSTRESAEERRTRIDNSNIEAAIANSYRSKAKYDSNRVFSNFNQFIVCLDSHNVDEEWTIVKKNGLVKFILIEDVPAPVITLSAVFSQDLKLTLYKNKTQLTRLNNKQIPLAFQNINDVIETLNTFKSSHQNVNESSVDDNIQLILDTLASTRTLIDEDKRKYIDFLSEQVKLFNCKKNRYRYSPDFVIFCSILFSISPHAYRYIRSFDYMILPHPTTVHKICLKYNTDPQIEQNEANFLTYIKQKFHFLKDSDKVVSLMIDEIYIKPYFDYKGGNIVGMAYNTEEAAKSAHVFMLQSLLSSFKEVVHILPVKTMKAMELFNFIKRIVVGLQNIGFNVVCVVSDNNSINRKAMSYFASPPQVSIVYKHPCKDNAPLFYILDSVHVLKCIRNNWINQKDTDQSIKFPSFENVNDDTLSVASFLNVKKLYQMENNQLVKYAHTLNLKSLSPSCFEKQNVKLVLNIFNDNVIQGLLEIGQQHNLSNHRSTAEFIRLIKTWWEIVNVKTLHKGDRFRNPLQNPLVPAEENSKFLEKFLIWLDFWKGLNVKCNKLTRETHDAISHTTHGLLQLSEYCKAELNFKYLLPGKIQTDNLEARFGKYRTMAGSQYLITIRQVFEVESKIRIQNLLPLTLTSEKFGNINLENSIEIDNEPNVESTNFMSETTDFDLIYTEEDFNMIQPQLPIFTYLAGYCARVVLKRVKCDICKKFLVLDKHLNFANLEENFNFIKNVDRGGLLYPHSDLVNVIMLNYITINKLISTNHENKFLKCKAQRELVICLTLNTVEEHDFFLSEFYCPSLKHTDFNILRLLIKTSTNIFLNNYMKKKNNIISINSDGKKRRKLETLTSGS